MPDQYHTGYKEFLISVAEQPQLLNSFKNNHLYREILEHVSYEQGIEYLKYIKESKIFKSGELTQDQIIDIIKENDRIGDPIKFKFDIVECSPTSLRYVYHAILALEHLSKKNYETNRIVEVGGGYGGLCLAISRVSKIMKIKIDKYFIIDLKEVTFLQEKYLEKFSLEFDIRILESSNFGSDIKENGLFMISNYCIGEIGDELVYKYSNNLFPKISGGFVTWNTEKINENMINIFNPEIEIEYPLTFWFNKYLRF